MPETIYTLVSPELPCNGCNRPGRAAIITKNDDEQEYTLDINCDACSRYIIAMYSSPPGSLPIGYSEPVEVGEYERDITLGDTLRCFVCGFGTKQAFVMRTDTEPPHNFKCFPYCQDHRLQVHQQVG